MSFGTGAVESPKDLRNYRLNKVNSSIVLPDVFELKHSHIKNQGAIQSCVAHALSEVLETKDGENYSTGWIYGYRPAGYFQGKGMRYSDALKTVKKVGYVKNSVLNSNLEMLDAKEVVDNNLQQYVKAASERTIKAYAQLNSITEIKQALYLYQTPILISIKTNQLGKIVLNGDYVAYIPTEFGGGHAMVCYGWSEAGLLIQNSWGEDWGNHGTFVLPYEYPISEAWMISFDKNLDNEYKEASVVKPNLYWLRELLQKLLNLLIDLLSR